MTLGLTIVTLTRGHKRVKGPILCVVGRGARRLVSLWNWARPVDPPAPCPPGHQADAAAALSKNAPLQQGWSTIRQLRSGGRCHFRSTWPWTCTAGVCRSFSKQDVVLSTAYLYCTLVQLMNMLATYRTGKGLSAFSSMCLGVCMKGGVSSGLHPHSPPHPNCLSFDIHTSDHNP